jgi:hypothetical protein
LAFYNYFVTALYAVLDIYMAKLCLFYGLVIALHRWPGKLFQDMIGPLFIGLKIRLEIIGEKKQFENGKHDNQFDQDDLPQGPTHGHGLKSVPIKGIDTDYWLRHTPPLGNCVRPRTGKRRLRKQLLHFNVISGTRRRNKISKEPSYLFHNSPLNKW